MAEGGQSSTIGFICRLAFYASLLRIPIGGHSGRPIRPEWVHGYLLVIVPERAKIAGVNPGGAWKRSHMELFVFPRWTKHLGPILGVLLVVGPLYVVFLVAYAASPVTTHVGYQPQQPVKYSHALHAGQLGIDCRYCHTTVEDAAFAAIPPTQTCMNCHHAILANSAKILPVKESYATGMPIEWIKVHDLPDYVYFNHSAHVQHGVGCVSCHGRVDKMEVVYQVKPLSMGWCLDCHRNPETHLHPLDSVTVMDWAPIEDQSILGQRLRLAYDVNPGVDCSTCHR